jgi:thymidylate synthase (FAD)
MQVELLYSTVEPSQVIEHAARVCYASEDKMKEGSAVKLVKACVNKGHLSVTEHATASFRVSGVSRALLAQITRHRMLSFCVRSQRYVEEVGWGYVMPPAFNSMQQDEYDKCMQEIAAMYDNMLAMGAKKEDARMLLPNGCHTEFVVTANFRAWLEFCNKRQDRAAQWEIRELADTIFAELNVLCPEVFANE